MRETHLTEEAKVAIRKYIVSLIAVPGIVITIGAGLAGYFFKSTEGLAKSRAVLETRVQAQEVLKATRV